MTWPGLPTSLHGDLVIEPTVDADGGANLVTRMGKPYGCWLDDTTPRLEHYVELAVARYGPLSQTVFVCVPPGRPRLHHKPCPPVVNVYESYWFAMGCDPKAWLPLPTYTAYCVQFLYPGTQGKHAPTIAQRERLLHAVLEKHPEYVFLF